MEKGRFNQPSDRPIEVLVETLEPAQTPSMRREALLAYAKAMLRAYMADQKGQQHIRPGEQHDQPGNQRIREAL
jgi:hypothetical protein